MVFDQGRHSKTVDWAALPFQNISQRASYMMLMGIATLLTLLSTWQTDAFDRARMSVMNTISPVITVVSQPVTWSVEALDRMTGVPSMLEENALLREENERLRAWYHHALGLEAENNSLRQLVDMPPVPFVKTTTAQVIADPGGSFVRSVLVRNKTTAAPMGINDIALQNGALVGRVTQSGEDFARVLLITDLNSRVPVMFASNNRPAILAGDNSATPRLIYVRNDLNVRAGDMILTSGQGGIYPAGIPVGHVVSIEGQEVRVLPMADLSRLSHLRLVDYGLTTPLAGAIEPR